MSAPRSRLLPGLGVVAANEIAAFAASPMTYVIAALFLGFSGVAFSSWLVRTNYASTSIEGLTSVAPFLLMFLAAVLTMRTIAEEKRSGVWELTMTSPVTHGAVVAGKYLACIAAVAAILALALFFPALLGLYGDPDLGAIVAAWLGMLLFAVMAVAVGIFASAVTANQAVAVALALGILLALWFAGPTGAYLPALPETALAAVAASSRYAEFARGIVDIGAAVYFVSVAAMFLVLAARVLEVESWR